MRDHKYEANRVDIAMSRFAGVACVILSTIGAVGLVVYTFW